MKKVLIIIPARDEASNLGNVLAEIKPGYLGVQTCVLVIDDGSKDATSEVARKMEAFVLIQKESLGVCLTILHGFAWGLRRGFDYFIVMDADGQHLPSYIQKVIKKLVFGFDVVCFTRFGSKSRVLYELPTTEKLVINTILSNGVNSFSRSKFTDVMCGFFGTNRGSILKMNLGKDRGYGLTLEILLKAKFLGFKVTQLTHPCIYFRGYPSRFAQYYGSDDNLGIRLASYVRTITSVLEELRRQKVGRNIGMPFKRKIQYI